MILKKDNRGSSYIELIIFMLVFSMVLMLIVKFMPMFSIKQDIGQIADGICTIISTEGSYNDTTKVKINDYVGRFKFLVDIDISDTNFISGTNNIQLGDQVVVKIKTTYDFSFFTFITTPVELRSVAQGMSEVYWK